MNIIHEVIKQYEEGEITLLEAGNRIHFAANNDKQIVTLLAALELSLKVGDYMARETKRAEESLQNHLSFLR